MYTSLSVGVISRSRGVWGSIMVPLVTKKMTIEIIAAMMAREPRVIPRAAPTFCSVFRLSHQGSM